MDTEKAFNNPDIFCPVMEMECPQGEEPAKECQRRFHSDFNPLLNWRDMEIICCSYDRREEQQNLEDLPPLV